jgi:uncharacterized membrane protein
VIGVAALAGVAVGAALVIVLRPPRATQLLGMVLMTLALAAAFVAAGALLPGLGMLLLGALAGPAVLAPLNRRPSGSNTPEAGFSPWRRTMLLLNAALGIAVAALLVGAGIAARSGFHHPTGQAPSLSLVGQHVLLGMGVPVLGLVVLTAATLVGAAALVARDRREMAEDQAEAQRRRRAEEQARRARQRAAARAAARQARRGAPR